jgi:5-methylcytosine-specific restriction endonuclease McrA
MKQPILKLKDQDLRTRFEMAKADENKCLAKVIYYLAEIDRRKLYLEEAYSSLYSYCVEKYHYSEGAAYRRIQVARLSQKYPQILKVLSEGKVHLSALSAIAPMLTQENIKELLIKIQGKTKKGVEEIVGGHQPFKSPLKDKIRRLPLHHSQIQIHTSKAQKNLSTLRSESPKKPKEPLGSSLVFFGSQRKENFGLLGRHHKPKPNLSRRVKIEFCAEEALANKITRAKEILKHKYPEGKLEDVMGEALELFLKMKDPIRQGERRRRRVVKKIKVSVHRTPIQKTAKEPSRYIPAKVKHDVYRRDQAQCSFIGTEGKRCQERGALQIDHIQPFALGGPNTVGNLRLLCKNHNLWLGIQTFGFVKSASPSKGKAVDINI